MAGATIARPFTNPERVTIRGYEDDAMEPFVSRDGRLLFFNNRNEPPEKTDLHYAERIDGVTFQYKGKLRGANSPALDAVPSMDTERNFYFVSTRTYGTTLSTLYRGRFADGEVTGIELVRGVSPRRHGMVNFDAEISPDGEMLYFVDGEFSGGAVPRSADLVIAQSRGRGFERLLRSTEVLRHINTAALEYAPAISADGLELFFTRLERPGRNVQVAIFRATRGSPDEAFGAPESISAIDGFVEAPALSSDGRSLYYHRLDRGRFVLHRVTR